MSNFTNSGNITTLNNNNDITTFTNEGQMDLINDGTITTFNNNNGYYFTFTNDATI